MSIQCHGIIEGQHKSAGSRQIAWVWIPSLWNNDQIIFFIPQFSLHVQFLLHRVVMRIMPSSLENAWQTVVTTYFYSDLFHSNTKKLPRMQHCLLCAVLWMPRAMCPLQCVPFTHSGSLRVHLFPPSLINQVPSCALFIFVSPKPSTLYVTLNV